jgi:hypothetical protein
MSIRSRTILFALAFLLGTATCAAVYFDRAGYAALFGMLFSSFLTRAEAEAIAEIKDRP